MLIQSQSGENYLTFDDDAHTYTLNGKLVPGVTTILHNGLPTSHVLINWMVKTGAWYVIHQLEQFPEQVNRLPKYLLDEIAKKSTGASKAEANKAAAIGSIVHDIAEKIESGKEWDKAVVEAHVDRAKIENCLKTFEEWREENKDEIIGHEDIIASVGHSFGGKYDRLCKRGKSLVLSDYKTSSSIYTSQFIQLAAYAIALEEWKGIKVDALEVLRFGKGDASFETKIIKSKKQIQELKDQFVRCRETYNFMKEWE